MIDFIGIGAQKAGTTWLYSRLNELPEFNLTPQKELHYFDRDRSYPSPNVLSESSFFKRLFNIMWLYRAVGKPIQQLFKGDFKTFKWYINYFYSNYNDAWYLSLFNSLEGKKGEITPSYAILKPSDIKRMHQLAPNIKLIFLLRNPIERAWSQFRHENKNNKKFSLDNFTKDEIMAFLNSESQELRSDYITTINNYKKQFPNQQLMIGFYDAISQKPNQLLIDIVKFIGGNTSDIDTYCKVNKIDNPSKKVDIPVDIEIVLKNKYHNSILQLAEQYGGYFIEWYELYYESQITFSKHTECKATFII